MTSSVETSSMRNLSGKCLCGTVHYEVEDQFRYSLNCHCSNCRRATVGPRFRLFVWSPDLTRCAEPIGSARPAPRTDPRSTVFRARPYRCGTP
jgi:hypothetical protein